MIYNQEHNIRIVGSFANLDGYQVDVADILKGAKHLCNACKPKTLEKARRLLLTYDDWGKKETQWEDALHTYDYSFIHMLIEQKQMIMPLIDILSDGSLFEKRLEEDLNGSINHEETVQTVKSKVNEVALAICGYISKTNESQCDKESIYLKLQKSPYIDIKLFIAMHGDVNGEAFKSLEVEDLESPDSVKFGFSVLKRTENTDLLIKYSKSKIPCHQHAIIGNPNTPQSTLDYLQKNVPECKSELISLGINPIEIIKSYIAESDFLQDPTETLTSDACSIFDAFLEWAVKNKDTYIGNENLEDIVNLIINLPALEDITTNNELALTNLILCDIKHITMSILDGDHKPGRTTTYGLACYKAGAFSKHTQVLDFVLNFIKEKYNESEFKFKDYAPPCLSIVEECAIGMMLNPHTPQSHKDEILKLGFKAVGFVMDISPDAKPSTHPYILYREVLIKAEQVRAKENI